MNKLPLRQAINLQATGAEAPYSSNAYDFLSIPLLGMVATLTGSAGTFAMEVTVQESNDIPPPGADLAIGGGQSAVTGNLPWQPTNWATVDNSVVFTGDGTLSYTPRVEAQYLRARWVRILTAGTYGGGQLIVNINGKGTE